LIYSSGAKYLEERSQKEWNWQWTPLHTAAHNGELPIVDILLECGADIQARTHSGFTPLHFAVKNGHASVVRKLLAENADPNATTSFMFSPLHLAAEYSTDPNVLDQLAEAGADLNAIGKRNVLVGMLQGTTPLECAALRDSPNNLIRLIELGAIVDRSTASATTQRMNIKAHSWPVLFAAKANWSLQLHQKYFSHLCFKTILTVLVCAHRIATTTQEIPQEIPANLCIPAEVWFIIFEHIPVLGFSAVHNTRPIEYDLFD
jgi:ankyrin repeat protein